jgi:hypothetical protein
MTLGLLFLFSFSHFRISFQARRWLGSIVVSEAVTHGRAIQQQKGPWGLFNWRKTVLRLPSFSQMFIVATTRTRAAAIFSLYIFSGFTYHSATIFANLLELMDARRVVKGFE